MRRIFWPRGSISSGQSIAVGWKNGEDDYVVTALLPYLEFHLAERILLKDELFKGTKSPAELYDRFNGDKLQVLASVNHFQEECDFTVHVGDTIRFEFADKSECMIIEYKPPRAHWTSNLSIKPLNLELNSFHDHTIISPDHEKDLASLHSHNQRLKEKIKLHTRMTIHLDMLETCISQINCSHELSTMLVSNAQKLFPELRKTRERSLSRAQRLSISVGNFGKEASKRAKTGVSGLLAYPFVILIWISMAIRFVSEGILTILNKELVYGHTLCYLSATAQQIDLNLRRICYFPEQLLVVRKRRHIWFTPESNEEYIRFYNSIWLGFNDRIFGWWLGAVIAYAQPDILEGYTYLSQYVFGSQSCEYIIWLMNWPGGLKLHTEITVFLGRVILWTITSWQVVCEKALPLIRVLIIVVSKVGIYGGMTLQIAIFCDIFSLLTLPFYYFYVSFAKFYRHMLGLFLSLFRLFRGKKWNVLRNRVDSQDYDMGQLFLGTIFFTVLLFLLPTLLIFYIAFTVYRLLVISVSAMLEMALGFFNHFPLFLLLLRIKNPGRIPGGIKISVSSDPRIAHTTLIISSYPLPLSRIFHQYNMVARRFTKHYFSLRIFLGLLSGGLVTIQRSKLYTILYTSLPRERTPIKQLYASLRKELLDD